MLRRKDDELRKTLEDRTKSTGKETLDQEVTDDEMSREQQTSHHRYRELTKQVWKYRTVRRCLRSRATQGNWQELGWIRHHPRCWRSSDSSCTRQHTRSSILRSPITESRNFLSDLKGNVCSSSWGLSRVHFPGRQVRPGQFSFDRGKLENAPLEIQFQGDN